MEQSEDTRDIIEGIRLENEGGRLLLNGTDISSSDDGDRVSLESLTVSDRSTFGAADQDNANAVENTGILLENFGQLLLERVGGVVSNGVFLGFSGPRYPDQPFFEAKGGIALEYLYSTAATSSGDTGNSNVMTLQFDGWNQARGDYIINLKALAEQPSQELDTKYSYTLLSERLIQIFETGFRSNIRWELVLGNTLGDSPSQKKFSLGGPTSLRGFPQAGTLQQDNYLLTRVDYEFPLITTPWWGNVSSLGLQGTVFFDQGRAWGDELDLDEAEDRRNVGVGIRWGVDAASLIQIPLKFEIAYPVGDKDYRSPQFIFFGVLTGS